eukprot:g22938.t1
MLSARSFARLPRTLVRRICATVPTRGLSTVATIHASSSKRSIGDLHSVYHSTTKTTTGDFMFSYFRDGVDLDGLDLSTSDKLKVKTDSIKASEPKLESTSTKPLQTTKDTEQKVNAKKQEDDRSLCILEQRALAKLLNVQLAKRATI